MHRHGALSAAAAAPPPRVPSIARARLKTLLVGFVFMALLVLLVHLVEPLQVGNFYPVGATLAGALTGFLFARAARQAPFARQVRGGSACAALAGAVGTLGFSLLGHLPLQNIAIAGITCAVAGATGSLLGALSVRPPRQ